MSSLDEMLPMDYVRPLAGGGTTPLGICEPSGVNTGGSRCNSGTSTGLTDDCTPGSNTGGFACNPGSNTGGAGCYTVGYSTW